MDPIWCVIANVAEAVHVGPGGGSVRSGTRHFSPGTKVYCFPPLWGDGYEHIKVLGHHRGSRGLVEMVMRSRHLTNWRAKLVYAPFVVSAMSPHWDGTEASKLRAEGIASMAQSRRACELCQIDERNVDLTAWWVMRAWPVLAFCRGVDAGRCAQIEVVTRLHAIEGGAPPPDPGAFATAVARVARIVERAVGVRPASAEPRDVGGHLGVTLSLTALDPSSFPPAETVAGDTAEAEAATTLAAYLSRPSIVSPGRS
jgi:hypothetical protein